MSKQRKNKAAKKQHEKSSRKTRNPKSTNKTTMKKKVLGKQTEANSSNSSDTYKDNEYSDIIIKSEQVNDFMQHYFNREPDGMLLTFSLTIRMDGDRYIDSTHAVFEDFIRDYARLMRYSTMVFSYSYMTKDNSQFYSILHCWDVNGTSKNEINRTLNDCWPISIEKLFAQRMGSHGHLYIPMQYSIHRKHSTKESDFKTETLPFMEALINCFEEPQDINLFKRDTTSEVINTDCSSSLSIHSPVMHLDLSFSPALKNEQSFMDILRKHINSYILNLLPNNPNAKFINYRIILELSNDTNMEQSRIHLEEFLNKYLSALNSKNSKQIIYTYIPQEGEDYPPHLWIEVICEWQPEKLTIDSLIGYLGNSCKEKDFQDLYESTMNSKYEKVYGEAHCMLYCRDKTKDCTEIYMNIVDFGK